ncbi:hypothetical protein [Occallatibacter riparius]|uniref:Uncharacterized protein n=1 Tax=Occallatibacter riparius TaxID=1002689 RepID=A0A9J7BQV5_9BACT|nr:hypothetical protein [Occallatibacter riparius]UWZ83318.1 hypothetical protein MOP44_22455 [Occallatibacter riparius]
MRFVGRLLGLALFLCLMPALHAADLSGAWTGSFDFQGTSIPVTINLKAADTTLTGNIEGLPTSPTEIHDGKIDGNAITFWVNSDYEGQTYKLVYKGKVNGDSIDFDFGTEDGSWGTVMTAKRQGTAAGAPVAGPTDVSGNWSGNFDFNGTSMPVTFKLQSSGATLTGTVEGMGPAPVTIKDGKVDGDTVSFNIDVDYQGQTYTLAYKGKVQAGTINFDFGTMDGSWGSSITAKK